MKTLNRLLSALFGIITLILMIDAVYQTNIIFQPKEDKDLLFIILGLITSSLFLMFSIIEEQKEEIHKLKKTIYTASKYHNI